MTSQIYKVVEEVLNAYQSSVCYKVSEALDVKRRECKLLIIYRCNTIIIHVYN